MTLLSCKQQARINQTQVNEFAVGSVTGSGQLFRVEYRDYAHFRGIARMMQIMDDEKVEDMRISLSSQI